MENIDNHYIRVELLERYFEVKITPAEFGDWLIARGRFASWDSRRIEVEGYTAWRSYAPSRLERLEHQGPELVIGLPFRVSAYLINEEDRCTSDYRDYTPVQFWLVKRGEWTEVTAFCKPPGAWPETAEDLRQIFDLLVNEARSRFGDDFKWTTPWVTAVASQPDAADVANNGAGDDWLTRPVGLVAGEWGMDAERVKRWRKIKTQYRPEGLRQYEMAEREGVSPDAIKSDFRDMRKRGLIA